MSTNMNMNMLKEERNRGYLIAGIGAIVAFIAFFLPYAAVSLGILGSYAFSAAQAGGLLWLVFILILVAIAISAIMIFRGTAPSPFGISGMPVATQVRYAVYGLIGAGVLGIVLVLLNLLTGYGYGIPGSSGVGPSFGFFLLLLALIAVAVGGFLAMRTVSAAPSSQQPFPPSQQWPSVQPPQQQWQQPQSTQYAPPPQYTPPPQQYPPAQQPWAPPSEQQWPPQQQPPQQQQQPPWQ